MPASQTMELIIRARDEAKRELDNLNRQLSRTQRTVLATRRAFGAFGRGLGRLRSAVFSLRSAFVGLGITLLARELIEASNEQAKAVEGLEAAMKSMGRYTPELSSQMQRLASSLQATTNFGDEATIQGQKFLVTYRNISDELLPRATKVMLDYAALMGGDTVLAANALGKASLGMTGELRRAGIVVDAQTFKLEGFRGVLREIEEQVAGQAEAQRRATGSLIAFGNAFGDTKEYLGDILKLALEPLLKVLVEEFTNLNNRIQKMKEEGRLHEWAREWATTILNGLELIGKVIGRVADAWRGWKLIFLSLKIAFSGYMEVLTTGLSILQRAIGFVFENIGKGLEMLGGALKKLDWVPFAQGAGEATEQVGEMLRKVKDVTDASADVPKYWKETRQEAVKQLDTLLGQETHYERITGYLAELRKRANAYVEEIKKMEDAQRAVRKQPPVDVPSFQAMAKSALARLRETTATSLAILADLYKKGEVTTDEYYNRRAAKMKQVLDEEVKTLEALAKTLERDPSKQLAIEDQIFKIKQKYQRDSLKLEQDRTEALKKAGANRIAIEKTFSELRARVMGEGAGALQARFEIERLELQARHEAEIQMLRDRKATEAEIEEAHRLQQLEKDKQIAAQRQQVHELTLSSVKSTLGFVEQAFGDAYEASGKKIKAFFYIQKAAAIASTLISTYEAAQKAYTAAVQIPIIGPALAVAAAAMAVAAGLARVATIRAQNVAAGGEIAGWSPHGKADNIPAWLTAGEFVHPVTAVKYYGAGIMEALRRKMIPRELLAGFMIPPKKHAIGGYAFQAGGAVAGDVKRAAREVEQPDINVVNVVDPNMMDQYVATTHGQRNILNVISQNAFAVKQILGSEG